MSLGIHKAGQGYWVRVLTAAGIAIISMAIGAWFWRQAEGWVATLPSNTWEIFVDADPEGIREGGSVSLRTVASSESPDGALIGTAVVQTFDPVNPRSFRIGEFDPASPTRERIPEDTRLLRGEAGVMVVQRAIGLPIVEPVYVSGGLFAFFVIVGAVLAYWLVGVKRQTAEFLIATDGEMKKVNWSSRRYVIQSTWVVIGASAIVAVFIFGVDAGLQGFFRSVGLLDF